MLLHKVQTYLQFYSEATFYLMKKVEFWDIFKYSNFEVTYLKIILYLHQMWRCRRNESLRKGGVHVQGDVAQGQ